jgi:hypothetical protein
MFNVVFVYNAFQKKGKEFYYLKFEIKLFGLYTIFTVIFLTKKKYF